MTDEEFVRANWEVCNLEDHTTCCGWAEDEFLWRIAIGPLWTKYEKTPEAAWSAAAEFTRDRLEQIRQLKREITSIDWILADLQINLNVRMASSAGDDQRPLLAAVERVAMMSRILARLEAALADLQQGMRTAAPDGPRRLGNG